MGIPSPRLDWKISTSPCCHFLEGSRRAFPFILHACQPVQLFLLLCISTQVGNLLLRTILGWFEGTSQCCHAALGVFSLPREHRLPCTLSGPSPYWTPSLPHNLARSPYIREFLVGSKKKGVGKGSEQKDSTKGGASNKGERKMMVPEVEPETKKLGGETCFFNC